jgi:protein TonB
MSGAGEGGNAVKASFTNFPYPWYITQVRNALWREWSKRMPKKTGFSTLVSFSIYRHGAIYSVQVEKASGNDSYDYAATSAANNSAPYPPLPKDFPRDILTVTVEFKNEE